jgi:hypothetical protein
LRAKCPSNKIDGKRGVNDKWSSSSMEANILKKKSNSTFVSSKIFRKKILGVNNI